MAVYTEVADEDLARFIAGYGLGRLLSYKGIAEGVENTNYLVHAEKGTYILTLYEKRTRREDLPFFIGLMKHLAANGITCPLPVQASDGTFLGELAGRPAAIVTFLEGVWPRKPAVVHCAGVGEALARMHLAGAGFALQRKNGLGPGDWPGLFGRFADQADTIARDLRSTIAADLAELLAAWPRHLPAGVIHADLFPDNVFFLGDKVSGLIDFYFACNDLYAYDVAVCLNAWCFEPDGSFNVTKGQALLRAYERVRPLSADERAALPILARGAALRFLLTRAHDWIHTPPDALVQRKDPIEYLRKMRFHRTVKHPRDYGLAS